MLMILCCFLMKRCPYTFRELSSEVLPGGDSEVRGAIARIAKTNTILKRPVENRQNKKNNTSEQN